MLRGLIIGIAMFLAAPLAAQNWTTNSFENGSLYFGFAGFHDGSIGFACTAPHPQGRPLIETGSHENHRTPPFQVVMTFSDQLFQWAPPYELTNVTVYLDGTGYRLPPVVLDELSGTGVYLSMADPMIQGLGVTQDLVLDTGQGTAYRYPVDGLAAAYQDGMRICVARWLQMGARAPAGFQAAFGQAAPAPQPAPVATPSGEVVRNGYLRAPSFPLPPDPPAAGDAHLTALCQGAWDVDPAALQTGDIDGDGVVDYLLNWTGVTCYGGLTGRAYCGAANCRIDLFLSSRGWANPEELLGIAADFVQDAQGRVGLLITGTPSVCGNGLCDRPFFWTGAGFSQ